MSALSPGTRLGPYEIIEPIGAGGMGEVYKASDTRLDRVVAIKVLPAQWAANAEMTERFEREARTIASLNHPHICVLHDIGRENDTDFLVMEYLEGETLAARLTRGALVLDEALKVAIAIADALDKAHSHSVVHRDLKPSNVMLTPNGPKLLDFGLAKRKVQMTRSDLTTPGAILGTLQYMAPEQLDGIEADARTDIFAFGALLHEMVTGKKTFEGQSQVLLMSAIATAEPPPLSKAQPATPAALEHVVKTCLAKDPNDRWQTARDVLAELEWIASGAGGAEGAAPTPLPAARRKRERLVRASLAAAVLFAALTAWPGSLYLSGPREPDEFRFRLPAALSAQPATGNVNPQRQGEFAVSPDGRAIAYVTQLNGPVSLFVRGTGSITPQPLPETEEASQPFWSADSHWIAFIAGGKLKKVEKTGGPPQVICDAAGFTGGDWNADGTIVFGSAKGLFRVSDQGGGKAEPLTTLDSSETGHFWPHFLPDGQHYLYLAWSGQASNRAVFAGMLGSKDKKRVMATESKAVYSDPGYLLFRRENAVYAQPFSAKKLEPSGDPVRVADQVFSSGVSGQGSFDLSQNGVLVYFLQTGGNAFANTGVDGAERQLVWTDRMGQVTEVGPRYAYRGFSASPDGTRIAVHRHDGAGGDIFVVEPPPRNSFSRITQDASHDNSMPIWSPDGKKLVYAALQKSKWGLYQALSDGSGMEELLGAESELPTVPMSWAPDGKHIVYWVQDPKTAGDLWILPLDGDKKPVAFENSAFNETHPQVSPDGKWIAYTSNRNGGRNEVYVRPFPSGSGYWQVSNKGGDWPRWNPNGKEIFYHSILEADAPGQTAFVSPLYSVPVSANGGVFVPGSPQEILTTLALNPAHSGGDYHIYDVSPDAKRFLLLSLVRFNTGAANAPANTPAEPDPANNLIVALHWISALKK